jgi:hypothetical protein
MRAAAERAKEARKQADRLAVAGRAVNDDEGATMNGSRYYVVRSEGTKYGIGFGSALAIAISYTTNKSILWAIIHGLLGWLYVIYFALFQS